MTHTIKTLALAAALMASLAGTTMADHHPGTHTMPDGKPCTMMLGKDGKPSSVPCADMPCCKKGMMKGMMMGGSGHSMMNMTLKGVDNEPSRAYLEANKVMHEGMDITFSGDADIDFLKGMIAHHQGAVDMAQVQLKYGEDAQVKRLSRDIIRAQNLEIRWMQSWLRELENKKKGWSSSSPVSKNNFWQ